MEHITAGGGVLFRNTNSETEVLLIYRNGTWDLPKGKTEPGESFQESAKREVSEELGIPEPVIKEFLCTTYHEYELKGRKIGKTTYWYSMTESAHAEMNPQGEEGITDLKWTGMSRAIDMVGFDNLKKVLYKFSGK